ncbi:hypothetical protein K227x_12070 [Rubripirellula lacrimiformis]|uniref:Uncharacterized protein n=1 Tax=Rubripirellula lacrimiformis TaxID=1930273 RepID=A0A517N758_9BACT|nr:hypothetical protein K227x_12070 [Rubripirellula lacrimiformis]
MHRKPDQHCSLATVGHVVCLRVHLRTVIGVNIVTTGPRVSIVGITACQPAVELVFTADGRLTGHLCGLPIWYGVVKEGTGRAI